MHQRYYALTDHVYTLMTIGHIRHDINTVDEFYEKERKYYDEMQPVFQNQVLEYMQKLYESPYRDYLESKIGPVAFKNMEIAMKAFDERVIALSQEENALTTEYDQLIASAKIPFDGKELNLSLLRPYLVNPDREIRRQAWQKKTEFFLENAEKLDEIYDKLVKNRTAQAKAMGYENYLELGYYRMGRNCYGQKEELPQADQAVFCSLCGKAAPAPQKAPGPGETELYRPGRVFPPGQSGPCGHAGGNYGGGPEDVQGTLCGDRRIL